MCGECTLCHDSPLHTQIATPSAFTFFSTRPVVHSPSCSLPYPSPPPLQAAHYLHKLLYTVAYASCPTVSSATRVACFPAAGPSKDAVAAPVPIASHSAQAEAQAPLLALGPCFANIAGPPTLGGHHVWVKCPMRWKKGPCQCQWQSFQLQPRVIHAGAHQTLSILEMRG